MHDESTDVVVVGAGTTGLALAHLLQMQGIRVMLVDPNPIVTSFPRGSHIDDETMRIFQTLGLAQSEPGYMVMGGVVALDPHGAEVFTWDVTEGRTEQGWLRDYQFFQPDFEATLRGRLYQSDRVQLMLGWRMTSVTDTGDSVEVEIENRRTGQVRSITASYLVGSDGARSVTRDLVSSVVEDLGGTRGAFIVDIMRFVEIESLPATRSTIFSGDRPVNYQPGIAPHARFNFVLTGREDLVNLTNPETVYDYLSPWIAPGDYRILRSDVYEFDAHLAHGWRRGRLLIAGDAAHLMPPYLGQGLCSGLRDAVNLAWKLARVVNGESDDSLLDTYEAERSPHVRGMIEESKRQGNLMAALSSGQIERPAAGSAEVIDRSRARIGLGIGIAGDPLVGELSAQPLIGGTLLDDIVGYSFALIALPQVLESIGPQTIQGWQHQGVDVVAADGPAAAWLSDLEAVAVILRPDRYIFSTSSSAESLRQAFAELERQIGADHAAHANLAG